MDFNKADKQLRNLKPRDKAYTVAVGDGILCRVAPNGTRTLELRARLNDKVARFTLGFYPSTTISAAAAKASAYRAMLKDGLSPKVAEQRAAGGDVPRNVREAAARFVEGHLAIKAGGTWAKEARRLIDIEVLPKLGHYPLQQLQRTDLTGLIEDKARDLSGRKMKGVAANRLSAVLGKFIGWCGVQGWLPPELGAKLPKPAVEKAKDRTLKATDTNNEVGVIWNALAEAASGSGPVLQSHARIMQLLALTGARCSEITSLTAADVNLAAGTIQITEGKTDASNRTLPLTPAARAIIEAQMPITGQGLLFPSPRVSAVIPSNEISRSCRRLVKLLKLTPFTPHDLRRTAISTMAEAGVDGDVRRRVTGHQAPDIHGRIYDRAQRLEDMRGALLVIENHYAAAGAKAAIEVETINNVVSIADRKNT